MTHHDRTTIGTDASRALRVQRQIHKVESQLKECERDLDALYGERVEGFHGEAFTAADADDLATQHQETIRADFERGVLKHEPATKKQRWLARVAPFADFLVFTYFLSIIFNASLTNP